MALPKHIKLENVQPGAAAEDRRILAGLEAGNSPPTEATHGFVIGSVEYVHVLCTLTRDDAATSFDLQVWYYSTTSEAWHRGDAVTVTDNDVITIQTLGLGRIYIELTGINPGAGEAGGVTPAIDAWMLKVVPV